MENGKRRQETGKNILMLAVGLSWLLAAGPQRPVSDIKVENAYVRVAAKDMMSAGYFKISNSSTVPDTLYSVKANFAAMAQLHESFRKNGMVGMNEVKFVIIPAKSNIYFKPGGYHVMLMNVKEDLKSGMKVKLVLTFRHAGKIEVDAPVK